MAIYEIVLRTSYYAQNAINRWNYVSSGTPGTSLPSFGLVQAMGFVPTAGNFVADSIAGVLQNLLNQAVSFVSVQARNVYDPTDFYEVFFPSGVVGAQTTDGMSPVMAYGFISNQLSLAIAKGHKRFVGVSEGVVSAGGTINTGSLGEFNSLAEDMSEILPYAADGAALNFSPAIVSKHKPDLTRVPPKKGYFYYDTETEQLAHTAFPVTWGVMLDVRSQVSRQYGRGI